MKVLLMFLLCNFTYSETGNKVIELNDANFEHLTQASTGATTGDWLVLLYVFKFFSFTYEGT